MPKHGTLTRVSAVAIGVAMAMSVTTGTARAAGELIVGLMVSKDYPFTKGAEFFAKRVAEETKGALKVKVFSDGVLGNEVELAEGIKRGTVDIAVVSPGYLSAFVPGYQILDIPFVFRDFDHWKAFLKSPVNDEMEKLLETKSDLVVLGNFGGSIRNVISRTAPMSSLDKMQGVKMRVWQAPVIINTWKAIGTVPSVVAYSEVYTALQTGVVDAAENEVPTFISQKWYEPTKFIALSKHSYTVRPFVMGLKQLKALSPEHQEIVRRLGREAADYENKVEQEYGESGLKQLQDKYGLKVVDVTDREKWIAATTKVREETAKGLGVLDLLNKIAAVGK